MKNKLLYLLLAITIGMISCSKFDELEADPNRSTTVPPGLVLRGLLKDMYYAPWSDEHRWNQYWCSNYNYYDDNEYSWTSANLRYTSLKNVVKMEEEAIRVGLDPNNSFAGVGKFLRAFYYYDMTMKVGDIHSQRLCKEVTMLPLSMIHKRRYSFKLASGWKSPMTS